MGSNNAPDIIYTATDEAPQLAAASLLPIIRCFLKAADLTVDTSDISVTGRVIASFPKSLKEDQQQPDNLAILGDLVKTPDANVIKLPNISASVPQLVAAVRELQAQGYDLPDYPENPETDEQREIRARYDAVKGSAVNPVLREGNSDRRSPVAVKAFAMANPHSMGAWQSTSKTHVSTMSAQDFRSNETSCTLTASQASGSVSIEFTGVDGSVSVLKDNLRFPKGTVVDATFMSASALRSFLAEQIDATLGEGTLFSLHLKATMMKVSDPILFGHAVRAYLEPVFEKHGAVLEGAGANPNSGIGTLLEQVASLPEKDAILADIDATLASRPPLYMVNSDRGITNLHVPSDVIIDASMPALIRAGGKAWGPDGAEADTNCVIPDSSYASVYDETINFFKANGALDPTTSGTVQNVGLMAQKAEEYGSHPTTFEMQGDGTVRVKAADGSVLHAHTVEKGDIWRMASTRQAPIENWVQLAIDRQASMDCLAIFWLDETRAHDAELIKYVKPLLAAAGATEKFRIMAPREATRLTLETITNGEDCIAVTGNVLRDYLTDLFPILELGTSAKMLSVVKLMKGGGLFETGAGGSAPKHVQQLMEENHLRWDSLGEFCALGESLRFLADSASNSKAKVLGDAVDTATERLLKEGKSPGRKVGQPDNRDSHFFFALYWAEALAQQQEDTELAAHFGPVARALFDNIDVISNELSKGRGQPVDLGGYYHPDLDKVASVMRPSRTFNQIIDA